MQHKSLSKKSSLALSARVYVFYTYTGISEYVVLYNDAIPNLDNNAILNPDKNFISGDPNLSKLLLDLKVAPLSHMKVRNPNPKYENGF